MKDILEKLREIEAVEKDPFNKVFYLNEDELETPEEHELFLTEMANMPGRFMKVEDVDFSFYISEKNGNHAIRLKVCWNRERLISEECGYLELHSNYEYHQSPQLKYKPKTYEVDTVRYFAKKYKVLFAAAWERKLDCDVIAEYFKGRMSWKELMQEWINIPNNDIKEVLSNCRNLKDLEYAVRKNNAFNMND